MPSITSCCLLSNQPQLLSNSATTNPSSTVSPGIHATSNTHTGQTPRHPPFPAFCFDSAVSTSTCWWASLRSLWHNTGCCAAMPAAAPCAVLQPNSCIPSAVLHSRPRWTKNTQTGPRHTPPAATAAAAAGQFIAAPSQGPWLCCSAACRLPACPARPCPGQWAAPQCQSSRWCSG